MKKTIFVMVIAATSILLSACSTTKNNTSVTDGISKEDITADPTWDKIIKENYGIEVILPDDIEIGEFSGAYNSTIDFTISSDNYEKSGDNFASVLFEASNKASVSGNIECSIDDESKTLEYGKNIESYADSYINSNDYSSYQWAYKITEDGYYYIINLTVNDDNTGTLSSSTGFHR